jgi:hypothetical protein
MKLFNPTLSAAPEAFLLSRRILLSNTTRVLLPVESQNVSFEVTVYAYSRSSSLEIRFDG